MARRSLAALVILLSFIPLAAWAGSKPLSPKLRNCESGFSRLPNPALVVAGLGTLRPMLDSMAVCDTLIKDPSHVHEGQLYRAYLSRASYHLVEGEYDEAIDDVDRMIELEQGRIDADPLFKRTSYARAQGLKAIALLLRGDKSEAAALMSKTIDDNPYNRVMLSTALLVGQATSSLDLMEQSLDQLVLLRPRYVSEAFILEFYFQGKSEKALSYARTFADNGKATYNNRIALAFLEAEAGDAAAGRRMAEKVVFELADGAKLKDAKDLDSILASNLGITPNGAFDTPMFFARIALAEAALHQEGREAAAAMLARLDRKRMTVPMLYLLVEMSDDTKMPLYKKGLESLQARMLKDASGKATGRLSSRPLLIDLVSHMPVYVSESKRTSYSGTVIILKHTGFKSKKIHDGAGRQISFQGKASTPFSMIDDLALLRAAEMTRKAKKTAFIIDKWNNYRRTKTLTMNGTPIGPSRFAGYKSAVDVIFVDPDNLPGGWKGQASRVIRVDEVESILKPLYDPD